MGRKSKRKTRKTASSQRRSSSSKGSVYTNHSGTMNRGGEEEKTLPLEVSQSELSTIAESELITPICLPLSEDLKLSARLQARHRRVDYAERVQYGITHLVRTVYAEEIYDGHAIARDLDEMEFRLHGIYALLGIPSAMLRIILSDNLPQEIYSGANNAIKDLFKKDSEWTLRESHRRTPAVYMSYLVESASKKSPSPSQYLRIVKRLEAYVSGNIDSVEQAVRLDNVRTNQNSSLRSIVEGRRWYLQGSITRTQTVLTFCEGLRKRFKALGPHEMDTPLQRPLGYLGYTTNPGNRFKEHAEGDTSWLHHLVLDAFRLEYGDSTYVYESVVLCYLAHRIETLVAEPLLRVLTDTTIETGGGFGIYQGGVKTTSSRLPRRSGDERNAVWTECWKWREEHTDFVRNKEAETGLLLAGTRPPGKSWYEEQIERDEAAFNAVKAENDAKEATMKNLELIKEARKAIAQKALEGLLQFKDKLLNVRMNEVIKEVFMEWCDSRIQAARNELAKLEDTD